MTLRSAIVKLALCFLSFLKVYASHWPNAGEGPGHAALLVACWTICSISSTDCNPSGTRVWTRLKFSWFMPWGRSVCKHVIISNLTFTFLDSKSTKIWDSSKRVFGTLGKLFCHCVFKSNDCVSLSYRQIAILDLVKTSYVCSTLHMALNAGFDCSRKYASQRTANHCITRHMQ